MMQQIKGKHTHTHTQNKEEIAEMEVLSGNGDELCKSEHYLIDIITESFSRFIIH